MGAERDLLFGLLALQIGLIEQGQLVAAFQAWARAKGRPLAEHLVERGDLEADQRSVVDALVALHLKKHQGDAEKSLASLPVGRSTRERIEALNDTDLTGTMAHVGSVTTEPDADRTATFTVGTATAEGQRFRVLRPYARGGLGAVFVALDGELNREVALKQILDHHADDDVSRRRFLLEAEITGGLEHPGIVPVYGLGSHQDGRPYYAMRFIRGDSLKQAIERFHNDSALKSDPGRRSLELRNLLRRFTDVCNAIEYAHSRGVLHRDIKPGNVIVGKHGETLVVDWGLARAKGRDEESANTGETTLMPSSASGSAETLPGQAMGTPAFMSPEQACGDLAALGPATDVYSLGATLYALLTGEKAFEGGDLGEVLRKVQRGEFPHPRQRDPGIDPALEAVCLKAMATKAGDRYASARALAEDVERWAADEPVSVYAEPFGRRARRWANRNRTKVTAAAVALLALLFGAAAVLAVQTRANTNLAKANHKLALAHTKVTQANDGLTRANADLDAAKNREAARFNLAKDAIRLFHGQVEDDLVLKADQFKPLRDKLLQGAADFYGKLEKLLEGQNDPASRKSLGEAYFELGDLTAMISNKLAALEVHQKSLEVRRKLAGLPDADMEAKVEVAQSLAATASLLNDVGRMAEAVTASEESRRLLEGLPPVGPDLDRRQAMIGNGYTRTAISLAATGKEAEAMAAYDKALEVLNRLTHEHPDDAKAQLGLSATHTWISKLHLQRNDPVQALESNRRALAIRQKLADDHPDVVEYQSLLADGHNNVGAMLSLTGKYEEALESYRRALAIREKLAASNPAVTEFKGRLTSSHYNIGLVLAQTDRPEEAMESLRRAIAIQQTLADANPDVTQAWSTLAVMHNAIGATLNRQGLKPTDALEANRRAQVIQQKLVDEHPDVTGFRLELAESHSGMGYDLDQLGRTAEAVDAYKKAVEVTESLIEDDPGSPIYQANLGYYLRRLAREERADGETAASAADARRAATLYEGLASPNASQVFELACCHAALAGLGGRDGAGVSAAEAATHAGAAMSLLHKAVAMGYGDPSTYSDEIALDPLRDRTDFQLFMLDLDFPKDPFVP